MKIILFLISSMIANAQVPAKNIPALKLRLSAVCPINSVTVGDALDKKTWVVSFDLSCTDQQKAQVQNIILGYVLNDIPPEEVQIATLLANKAAAKARLTTMDRTTPLTLPALRSLVNDLADACIGPN